MRLKSFRRFFFDPATLDEAAENAVRALTPGDPLPW